MTYDELSFRFKHNKFANNYLRPVLRPIVRALIWPFVNKRRKKEKEARHSDFLHNGQDLLARFNSAMKNAGIDYWLDFGTLLGAYREHGLIKHDMDLMSELSMPTARILKRRCLMPDSVSFVNLKLSVGRNLGLSRHTNIRACL